MIRNIMGRTHGDITPKTEDSTVSASIPRQPSGEISGIKRACPAKLAKSTQKNMKRATLDFTRLFVGCLHAFSFVLPHSWQSLGALAVVKITMVMRTKEPTTPMMTTGSGIAPESPPGQKRCAAHLRPSLVTEPLAQTSPNGALHGRQDELPFSAKVPTPHKPQVSGDDAPETFEALPASQAEQVVADTENLPASQAMHMDDPSPIL
jgi:hypothetical protein